MIKTKYVSNKTILIFTEGLDEQIFIEHLKVLYKPNSCKVKVKRGRGGATYNLVDQTIKAVGGFDYRVTVYDTDRSSSEIEKARQTALKNNIVVCEHNPCLESILLRILETKFNRNLASKKCKSIFQNKYLNGSPFNKRVSQLFSKTLIDKRRKKVGELDKIINILQGKFKINNN